MSALHVACAARHDYVPHTASMLHSVLTRCRGQEVHVHFLHGSDLPDDVPALLTRMVERDGGSISMLLISDGQVAGLRTRDNLPASHWYRIFLPELLDDLDRILYLDGDLIALESLRPLWEVDLGDSYLAAVTNIFQHDHVNRIEELGLPGPNAYFNSGVMVMNLELMRADGCSEALVEWALAHYDLLAWPEQDALNMVLGHRRLALHPRWNCMNSVLLFPSSADVFGAEVVAEARRRPAIRHFEGPSVNKPWHYLCDRGMRELYFAHRRHTPWPEFQLEGRTPGNVVRRLARDLRRRSPAPEGADGLSA